MSPLASAIGSTAAILGVLCWLPQVARTWRTRQTRDLSLSGTLLILTTLLLWLVYGLATHAWPLVIGNGIAGALVGSLVVAKLLYR